MSEQKRVQLPIKWDSSLQAQSHYVTNMIIQRGDHEFIISFFEIKPPLVLGTPEDQEKAYSSMDGINAECIARLVVAPERMQEFSRLFSSMAEMEESRLNSEVK